MFVLTLTDDKLLKFVLIWGKVVLRLFGEKSWVGPEPFLSYYSLGAEFFEMKSVDLGEKEGEIILHLKSCFCAELG